MQFSELNIIEPILRAIQEEGYTTPTPIQEQAIPLVLDGNDLMGCAQTGTGKTAAFSIPILQLLSQNKEYTGKKKIRALIVTPTRELAIQIDESLKAYGRYAGLTSTVIFGGVNQNKQTGVLKNGVESFIGFLARFGNYLRTCVITFYKKMLQQFQGFLLRRLCFERDKSFPFRPYQR